MVEIKGKCENLSQGEHEVSNAFKINNGSTKWILFKAEKKETYLIFPACVGNFFCATGLNISGKLGRKRIYRSKCLDLSEERKKEVFF